MAPSSHPTANGLTRMLSLEKFLQGLPESETTLSDERLKSLNIQRAPQLNIDNPAALDDCPVFFQPLDDSPKFRKTLEDTEKEIEFYSICPYKKDHVDRLSCATQTLSWFHSAAKAVYPEDQPQWLGTSYGPYHRFPSYFGREVATRKGVYCPKRPPPEWMTKIASGVIGRGYRHVSLWVVDNTSHEQKPGEPLRSEIAPAVRFVRKQMEITKRTDRTTPVILYSMHHNDTVRVTQVWWDGEKGTISFRQSRILHIASESFTAPDVLLLIRWKACIPLLEPKQAGKPAATESQLAVPVRGASPAQSGPTHADGRPNTGTGVAHVGKTTTTSPHRSSTPEKRTTATGAPVDSSTHPRHASTHGKASATVGDKHGSNSPQRSRNTGMNAAAVKSTIAGTTQRVNIASPSAHAAPNRATNLPNRGTNNDTADSRTQRPAGHGTSK